jgi:hypothetical protein
MKKLFVILAMTFSFGSFAQEIVKETWTCKNDKVSFTAVVTDEGVKAHIFAHQSEKITLNLMKGFSGLEDGLTTKLNGEEVGWDSWYIDATLVRNDEAFEWSENNRATAKGQLSLVTNMSIDCVGDRVAADLVDCKVVIERK